MDVLSRDHGWLSHVFLSFVLVLVSTLSSLVVSTKAIDKGCTTLSCPFLSSANNVCDLTM